MTARAEIIARITAKIEELNGAAPGVITPDLRLADNIDSLELIWIAQALEEEFLPGVERAVLEPTPDWTVDKIADAVIAAMARGAASSSEGR